MDSNNQLGLEETLEQMRRLLTDINPVLYPNILRLLETHIQLVKATEGSYGDAERKKEGPG